MLGWWAYKKVQKIEGPQLRNLVNNRIPFYFFSFVKLEKLLEKNEDPETIRLIESLISRVQSPEVALDLADKSAPIVLLCKRGFRSARLAVKMRDSGFINVYVVEGGWKAID